jgi:alpha-ketoglutarate-dependent taurine dioxygenase
MASPIFYHDIQDATPETPMEKVAHPSMLWMAAQLREADYKLSVPDDCLEELRSTRNLLEAVARPATEIEPEMFRMPESSKWMARVKAVLDNGPGFAVLDRIPLQEFSGQEATSLFWLLMSLMSRPVQQDWAGNLLIEVMDLSDEAPAPDAALPPKKQRYGRLAKGARGQYTNSRLVLHTDGAPSLVEPQYVALLCLQPAMEGGESRVISWHTAFNELRRASPELIARGFRAFLHHRQQQHAPGAPEVISKPLFFHQGRLKVCYSSRTVRTGYETAGEPIDDEGLRFLNAMDEILARGDLKFRFSLEPGQMQIINNWETGHERTEYQDHPDEEKKRCLIRLHLRDRGRPQYEA